MGGEGRGGREGRGGKGWWEVRGGEGRKNKMIWRFYSKVALVL